MNMIFQDKVYTLRIQLLLVLIGFTFIFQGHAQEKKKGSNIELSADLGVLYNKSSYIKINEYEEYAYHFRVNNILKNAKLPLPSQFSKEEVFKFIDNVNSSLPNYDQILNPTNLNEYNGMAFFLETLLAMVANSNDKDQVIANSVAMVINEATTDINDRYRVLSFLSSRLYENYQDARNPGSNNHTYNPTNISLPNGEISFKELLSGAYTYNKSLGGVCNDISQAIAMIAGPMFPEKDVLVITGGTHMGTLITDGQESLIIDAGDERLYKNNLSLFQYSNATNIRLSKVIDGKLSEIAVMDTEQGQLVNETLDIDRPFLKSSNPLQKIVVHLNKWIEEKNKRKILSASFGSALLNNSNMFVISLKAKKEGQYFNSYAGVAVGLQNATQFNRSHETFHLRMGVDGKVALIDNSQFKLDLKTGVALEGSFGATLSRFDTSGNILFNNNLHFFSKDTENNSSSKLKHNTDIYLSHALGSNNYGRSTGLLSKVEFSEIGKIIKSLSFHFNQLVINTEISKEFTPRSVMFTNLKYQGSHVGQNFESKVGISFLSRDKKREYLIWAGYDNSQIGGYITENNLIYGFDGATLGTGLKSSKGLNVNVQLREIKIGKTPYLQTSIKIPLYSTKK